MDEFHVFAVLKGIEALCFCTTACETRFEFAIRLVHMLHCITGIAYPILMHTIPIHPGLLNLHLTSRLVQLLGKLTAHHCKCKTWEKYMHG